MAKKQHEIPISLAKMDEYGLDKSKQASCSEPGPGNMGCWAYNECRLKEKATGAGPCNKGMTVVKQGVMKGEKVLFNSILTCFHIPPIVDFTTRNGGVCKIVASEGEELPMLTTRREPAKKVGDLDILVPIVQKEIVPVYAPESTNQSILQSQLAQALVDEGTAIKEAELLDSVKEEFGGRRKPGPKPKTD